MAYTSNDAASIQLYEIESLCCSPQDNLFCLLALRPSVTDLYMAADWCCVHEQFHVHEATIGRSIEGKGELYWKSAAGIRRRSVAEALREMHGLQDDYMENETEL